MSKKSKRYTKSPPLTVEEFAARHGIRLETAKAILEAFGVPPKGGTAADGARQPEPRRLIQV